MALVKVIQAQADGVRCCALAIMKSICTEAHSTTNNRMEISAVIHALKALKQASVVELYTDSQYVQKGVTEWLNGWKARGWKTADKSPVKNVDLWQELDALLPNHEITWYWVRGHSGHPGNELADQLANRGVEEFLSAK